MALGEVSEINVQEIDSFEILEFNNLETMKRFNQEKNEMNIQTINKFNWNLMIAQALIEKNLLTTPEISQAILPNIQWSYSNKLLYFNDVIRRRLNKEPFFVKKQNLKSALRPDLSNNKWLWSLDSKYELMNNMIVVKNLKIKTSKKAEEIRKITENIQNEINETTVAKRVSEADKHKIICENNNKIFPKKETNKIVSLNKPMTILMVKILKNSVKGMLTSSEIYEQLKLTYNGCARKAAVDKTLAEHKYFIALDDSNWIVDPEFEFKFNVDFKSSCLATPVIRDETSKKTVTMISATKNKEPRLSEPKILPKKIEAISENRAFLNIMDRNDLRVRIPQASEWFAISTQEKEWWKKNRDPDFCEAYPYVNDSDFEF